MFPNLLFTMSLAGSTVFLLYILAYPFAKEYFSLKWRYRVLKIAAAFYLLPVPLYKYLIIDVIHRFFPWLWEKNRHISEIVDMEYIIIIGRDFVKFSSGVRRMLLAALLAGIVSFAIKKGLSSIGNGRHPADWERKLFIKVKNETGIKKDVEENQIVKYVYDENDLVSEVISFENDLIKNVHVVGYGNVTSFKTLFDSFSPAAYS